MPITRYSTKKCRAHSLTSKICALTPFSLSASNYCLFIAGTKWRTKAQISFPLPSLLLPRLSPVCLSSHQDSLLVNKGFPPSLAPSFLSFSLIPHALASFFYSIYPSYLPLSWCLPPRLYVWSLSAADICV